MPKLLGSGSGFEGLEVIAGSGEYQNFDLNLVDTLDAPDDVSPADKLAFATLFVDRLAFLKLLADRGLLRFFAVFPRGALF